MTQRLPTLFIPHGGGPWPFMPVMHGPADTWDRLADYLRGLDQSLGVRPKAVLVISGHWEEPRPTVNVSAKPPLLFDYYNFPEHTYRLTYPAPGAPELAHRVEALLAGAGFKTDEDGERGYDHGVFITTSRFTKDAVEASYKKGAITILLLDGQAITELMLERGIGVVKQPVYLYEIVSDFFDFDDEETV